MDEKAPQPKSQEELLVEYEEAGKRIRGLYYFVTQIKKGKIEEPDIEDMHTLLNQKGSVDLKLHMGTIGIGEALEEARKILREFKLKAGYAGILPHEITDGNLLTYHKAEEMDKQGESKGISPDTVH